MRANAVTFSEVFETADALLIEGDRPTIEKVRQRLGRGSPNTVTPMLDAWFRGLGARIRDPAAYIQAQQATVPGPIQAAAKTLWDVAKAETMQDFDKKLAAGLEASLQAASKAQLRAADFETRAEHAESAASALQKEVGKTAEALASEHAAHQSTKVNSAAQLSEAVGRISELQTRLEEAASQVESIRDEARARITVAEDRSKADARRAALEIDAARQARINVEKRLEAAEGRLQVAASQAAAAHERFAEETIRMARAEAIASGEAAALRSERRSTMEQYVAERTAAQSAMAELREAALARERTLAEVQARLQMLEDDEQRAVDRAALKADNALLLAKLAELERTHSTAAKEERSGKARRG